MKVQAAIAIQSDEGQAEVVHEMAYLERVPSRPGTLSYPWPKRTRFWPDWSNRWPNRKRQSLSTKNAIAFNAVGNARAKVTMRSCSAGPLAN